ncbi:MAG: ChrR family anti-sigma-E factor [Cohaesibacteraceae bacterium]
MGIVATRQNDMVSGLMAEYALGSLSEPVRVLMESHLELSSDARSWLSDIETVGSVVSADKPMRFDTHVLDAVEPVDLSDRDASLDAIWKMIDSDPKADDEASSMPKALQSYIGMPMADVPWKSVMPGLAEYKLPEKNGAEVSLIRIDSGKAVPVHTHHGAEITLVLQGGFSDESGHYGVGDIAFADDDINHKPLADKGEVCICFAVVDAPVELTGPIGRLMNSFRR